MWVRVCFAALDDEDMSLSTELECPTVPEEPEEPEQHEPREVETGEHQAEDTMSLDLVASDLPLDGDMASVEVPMDVEPSDADEARTEIQEAEETEGTQEAESVLGQNSDQELEGLAAEQDGGSQEEALVTGHDGESQVETLVHEQNGGGQAEQDEGSEQEVTAPEQMEQGETEGEEYSQETNHVEPVDTETMTRTTAAPGVVEEIENAMGGPEPQPVFSEYGAQAEDEDREEEEGCSLRMRGAAKRKNRPCSLPVCELETVIASTCEEPETPRSHYIRLHRLLHSLPSNQSESSKTEEEDEEEEQDEDVAAPEPLTPNGPRRSLPRSRSHQRLSELVQILDGECQALGSEGPVRGQSSPGESEGEPDLSPVPCCSHMVARGAGAMRAASLDSARCTKGSVFSSQEDEDDMDGLNGILDLEVEPCQGGRNRMRDGTRWEEVPDTHVQSPHGIVGNGESSGAGTSSRSEYE